MQNGDQKQTDLLRRKKGVNDPDHTRTHPKKFQSNGLENKRSMNSNSGSLRSGCRLRGGLSSGCLFRTGCLLKAGCQEKAKGWLSVKGWLSAKGCLSVEGWLSVKG